MAPKNHNLQNVAFHLTGHEDNSDAIFAPINNKLRKSRAGFAKIFTIVFKFSSGKNAC